MKENGFKLRNQTRVHVVLSRGAGFLAVFGASLALAFPAMAEPLELRVMTFNLKYASEDGEHRWSERRGILKNAVFSHDPDILGTQEGLYEQLKDIQQDLPQYNWIGLGRAGGSKGEFMAIFYKSARFEPLAYDHFWLSDTPEVIGSRTWGHENRRMVTWVRFRDKETNREFYHWNTHFDHRVQQAREKSADLVMRRLREIEPRRPVVVTGDFNAAQDSVVHDTMVARGEGGLYLRDAWDEASVREGAQVGTGHGWRGPGESTRRIDWILVSPEFRCGPATVVTYEEAGQFPSDHFPVVCDLELP